MKKLLSLEEAAQCVLTVYGYYLLHLPLHWGWAVLLFFSPDLGFLGYLVNTKTGAFTYNFLHHKLVSILLIAAGYFGGYEFVLGLGLLYYAHSSFDRALGYGLKFSDDFSHTHLGYIGKKQGRDN